MIVLGRQRDEKRRQAFVASCREIVEKGDNVEQAILALVEHYKVEMGEDDKVMPHWRFVILSNPSAVLRRPKILGACFTLIMLGFYLHMLMDIHACMPGMGFEGDAVVRVENTNITQHRKTGIPRKRAPAPTTIKKKCQDRPQKQSDSSLNLEFLPYCDDLPLFVAHQDPNVSSVLIEEFHDQYSQTKEHTIMRLGENISFTAQENKQTTDAVLRYVTAQLDRMGFQNQHMIFFGTLLGAYRHHDFIPWDDDADIVLLSQDIHKLRSMLLEQALQDATQRKNKTQDHNQSSLYQWIVRSGKDSNAIPIKVANLQNGRYVDIFALHPNPKRNNKLVVANYWKIFGEYPPNTLFPVQPCVFGQHIYNCPHDTKQVLTLKYRNLKVPQKERHKMKGLPEYAGIVATLAEADVGRLDNTPPKAPSVVGRVDKAPQVHHAVGRVDKTWNAKIPRAKLSIPKKHFGNCGVPDKCTEDALAKDAGGFFCGDRINYLITDLGQSEAEACKQVAVVEFPGPCGPCAPPV